MSFIAIVGAGAIGGALAQRLAARGRVREVRLIDDQGSVAQGKALDIQQSGAVDGFTTTLTAASCDRRRRRCCGRGDRGRGRPGMRSTPAKQGSRW